MAWSRCTGRGPQLEKGRAGNQRLGLPESLKLLPTREAAAGRACLSHKARPQLLSLPGTDSSKLRTAQAEQQEQAGQVSRLYPLLPDGLSLRTAGRGPLNGAGPDRGLRTGLSHPGLGRGSRGPEDPAGGLRQLVCAHPLPSPGWREEGPLVPGGSLPDSKGSHPGPRRAWLCLVLLELRKGP